MEGMNIAFDGVAIFGPGSQNRGIGNYTISQVSEMVRMDSENHYYIMNLMEHEASLADYLGEELAGRITLVDLYCGKEHILTRNQVYADLIGNIIRWFVREYSIDVFYITTPFDGNMMPYRKEWFGGARVVATVYDIIPYVMQENFFIGENAELAKSNYEARVHAIMQFDKILVISQSVKEDLLRYFAFKPDQIEVIYAGVDTIYQQKQYSQEQKEELFRKYHITRPYVVCTGGKDARKNLDGLIEGYSRVKDTVRDQYDLVIVGKLPQERIDAYMEQARVCGVGEHVLFTNYVDVDELVMLNNLAVLAAFPSKYEGFGLPVVEAWACGTPVLTSSNSSLGEIGQGAAILVDPNDMEDIGRGLEYALTEADLDEYTRLGQERLALYDWKKVAADTIAILNQFRYNREAGESAEKDIHLDKRSILRSIGYREIYQKQYSEREILRLVKTLAIALP